MKYSGKELRSRISGCLEREFVVPGEKKPYSGGFSLLPKRSEPDLYGMVDAAYILYTLDMLGDFTTEASRQLWAQRILACQDEEGWFSLQNLRGHSREHATAYAISAMRLLEIEPGESYVSRIRPLTGLFPVLSDQDKFNKWISQLDFRLSPAGILKKKLGWHYIWSGSHVGGGIAAAAGMAGDLLDLWWPGAIDLDEWFRWYFTWLDEQVNPKTGLWQRAFWNHFYRQPTLIDMGGAVHFYWIYEARGHRFPYAEQLIRSTLSLQRSSGLYRDHPFCIDLDGNFNIIRSYLQLPPEIQVKYRESVYQSAQKNFEAVARSMMETPLEEIYRDSHGLPGALAALVECIRLPGFKYSGVLKGWQHPLDRAWWL